MNLLKLHVNLYQTTLVNKTLIHLIIYGGVGLGKTHLMHAIGNNSLKQNPNLNIVNITSEQFTLDFVNSLRKNKTIEFAQIIDLQTFF